MIAKVKQHLRDRENKLVNQHYKAVAVYNRTTDSQAKMSWEGRVSELAGRLDEVRSVLRIIQRHEEFSF